VSLERPAPVGSEERRVFSDVLKDALDAEVIGQPRAVHGVVRGVTWALSGMARDEGPLCCYMFLGPSGTGKTHLVEVLAKTLHGDTRHVTVADCTPHAHGDPWMTFVGQIAHLFACPQPDDRFAMLDSEPLSILLVEYLERARPEVIKALAAALENGQVMLPDGRRGNLRRCLVFITSALCSREILEEGGSKIGFSGSGEDESERTRIFKMCSDAAQHHFGTNLMARLDDLVVFHKLEEDHRSRILDRQTAGLNRWLLSRGFHALVLPEAREFLLERGRRNPSAGARELLRAHRRFVEFPVADLAISGRIPREGIVVVEHRPPEKSLHFTVREGLPSDAPAEERYREVPVAWDEYRGAEIVERVPNA
jgi:ATP-dependent Clp protease ATP-binding subunit ClpC